MAIELRSLRADLKRESEGDWVAIPDLPGVELCCRSVHHQPFQDALNALARRNNRRYGEGRSAPAEDWARDFGALLAEYLLLGWRGFDDDYSDALALETLTDLAMRPLRDAALWAAQQVGQNQVEFVKDAGKNSARSSAGGSRASATPPSGSPT